VGTTMCNGHETRVECKSLTTQSSLKEDTPRCCLERFAIFCSLGSARMTFEFGFFHITSAFSRGGSNDNPP